ncbi:MAG: ferredoxin [Clostridia bacterium]|nr:ferredoxin [Clostridia bacterium]
MIINSNEAELNAVVSVANAMCAAARTAPKAKGEDFIYTCVLTGEDKENLAKTMYAVGERDSIGFFMRDSGNVSSAQAVVLIGAKNARRGLGEMCQNCGYENCAECAKNDGKCAFTSLDLGIAVGSAVSIAADYRIDNRIMFSCGAVAKEMGLLPEAEFIMAIPLSATGKSPFFDRSRAK